MLQTVSYLLKMGRHPMVWLALLLILPGSGHLRAAANAQELLNRRVNLSIENADLRRALNEVEKAAEIKFTYRPKLLPAGQRITLLARNETLSTVLDRILTPLKVRYEVVGQQIVLSRTPPAPDPAPSEAADLPGQPMDRTISGRVTDGETSEGLAGVSVVLKGTSRGTTTNAGGNFQLSVPDGDATLVFSFIGYGSQEARVSAAQTVVNVRLMASNQALSEVVVVGYGTQKRTSVTGAISTVGARELAALPVIDARQALQGRVPGVSVVNNGSPGEEPIVRIRGIGSINFAANPLYVVDGMPVGELGTLDPRDIESVEVLKDAAAASIYGSRAANGVIMVSTKKGRRDGKIHVDLDSYYGTQSAWRKLDVLNREEYIRYGTALRTNAGQAPPARFNRLNEPIYDGATQTYAQTDTDWQDAMFRSAPISQTNISISKGDERSRFWAGAGYFKQQGIMLGTGYERFNLRLNSDFNLGKIFTFGQSLTIGSDYKVNENNQGGRPQIMHMIRMTPYIPIEDPTRPGGFRGPSGDDGTDPQNPVRIALQDRSRNNRLRLLGTAFLEANIVKGLKYRFTAGVDYSNSMNRLNNPIYNESFNARQFNRVEQNVSTGVSPYFSNQLTYDLSIGKHVLNVIAVGERQGGVFRSLQTGGQYTTNELTQVTNTMRDPGVNGFLSESLLFSYLGRVNYEYAGKYLLSASFRRDGSSVFAPGRKWGNFPSVSVGWRISEEPFMKDIPSISELKVRASYGTMGFNGIENYAWQPVLQQNTAPIFGGGREQGTFTNRLGNSELGWEITEMTNVGVDLGLWNNRLTFQAEYFNRITDGLILNQPLAPSLGFSNSTPANVGSMRNRGMEFQVGYRQTERTFRWDLSANLGFVRNRVLSFGENITSPIFDGSNGDFGGEPFTITRPGDPVQSFYGWVVDGIFQNAAEVAAANALGNDNAPYQNSQTAPGDIRFRDIDGNGVINGDDRVILGSFLPDFSYGINFSANYKNFDLTMFLQGVQGNKIYNGVKVLQQGMLRLFNASPDVLNAWTPTNTNTDVPRAVDGDPNRNSRTSDRFLEDGSYLRVKNLSVGYTLPASTLGRIAGNSIARVRFYVSSANLLTLTRYTGYDPEIGSRFNGTLINGIDYGQFPAARTLFAGIQVGF